MILWVLILILSRIPLTYLFKQVKKEEQIDSHQYSSDRFKTELTNLDLLKKEELLSEEEYNTKVNQIIESIKTFGISETKEVFLVNILPLKEKGILTKEILEQLK